jgi:hypothetical protein
VPSPRPLHPSQQPPSLSASERAHTPRGVSGGDAWSSRGGISVDGLLKLYNHMGVATLSTDMATLGIPAEGTQQQLAALRSAVRHLRDLEAKLKTTVTAQAEIVQLQRTHDRELRKMQARVAAAEAARDDAFAVNEVR